MKLKIKDDFDLDKLINYGFIKNKFVDYSIYVFIIEKADSYKCEILVNTTEFNDRTLRFYYTNDLDSKEYCIDYDVPIPGVIFKLIKGGVVEYDMSN